MVTKNGEQATWPKLIEQMGNRSNPWLDGERQTAEPRVDSTAVLRRVRLWPYTSVGANSSLTDTEFRDYAYAVADNQIYNADIGKFCNIASGVRINPTNHPTWRATLHHFTYRSRAYGMGEDDEEIFAWRGEHRVVVGPDVWIGHNAIVLPGVEIGAGAAIGAGAVVTKPVAPYTIVAGVPARPVRRRVEPAVEAALFRIAWWDWPHERLAETLGDFRRLDLAQFAAKYDPGA